MQTSRLSGNPFSSVISLHLKFAVLGIVSVLIFSTTLCSTFVHFKMVDNYFLLLPLSLSIGLVSIFSFLLAFSRKSSFCFSAIDFLFIVTVGYYAIRYDYQLQLANWKIIYAFLLLLLWFSVRTIFSSSLNLKPFFSFSLIGVGAALAIWGLLQLYGFLQSNHNLFAITGPFYNPGPYSGYIAMVIPLCLDRVMMSKGLSRHFYGIALFLMVCIIPAGMSRSAWLAILVSCLWLVMMRLNWIDKMRQCIKERPHTVWLCSVAAFAILLLILFFFFHIKSDSANGRLFIWKNTITAIMKQPVLGYGAGSFPAVYGHAQADYFAAGNYSEMEEWVAGSPEYAFNECLQMCIEGGILLLILVAAFFILSLRIGVRAKEYGICAALFCLIVFSMFSYPSHELSFGIAAICLLAICVSKNKQGRNLKIERRLLLFRCLFSCIMLFGSCIGCYMLRDAKDIAVRWDYANVLYLENITDAAALTYERLYDKLKHNPRFLLDYAKCLSVQENYIDANLVLERAKAVCCDPVLRNMQGRNYQIMKLYSESETCYKESVSLLPIRIYPYYLLAKLYSEESFFNKEKSLEMINIIQTKKPKADSKSIEEMRIEMTILSNKLLNYCLTKKNGVYEKK